MRWFQRTLLQRSCRSGSCVAVVVVVVVVVQNSHYKILPVGITLNVNSLLPNPHNQQDTFLRAIKQSSSLEPFGIMEIWYKKSGHGLVSFNTVP